MQIAPGPDRTTVILAVPQGRSEKRAQRNSTRKLLAHVERHAHWPAGLRINRAPERSSLWQQLAIAAPMDFSEPFERKPGRLTEPRAQHDVIAQTGLCFVVLVPQH